MYKYSNRGVTPSYIGTQRVGGTERSALHGETTQLLMGEVKKVIPVDSPQNLTKRYLEYEVEVQYSEGHGPTSAVTFSNCLLINHLAGVADRSYHTLRADPSTPKNDTTTTTTGAKVLILCVGGNAGTAFIIGGIREDAGKETSDHALFFEFNGAQATINKDGELQVRFRGQTKVDGTLGDDAITDAEGTSVIFTKTGGIKLFTPEEKQFIFVDHENKKLTILADEEWNVKVNKKLIFTAGDDVSVTGDAKCTIEMKDNVIIKSAGVLVGDATDHWLLADTYRGQETQMMKQLAQGFTTLQGLLQTAAISLTAAAGLNAIPIVGGASAAGPIIAAATALNAAAPICSAMGLAINLFEAQASTYLSKKNKND